MVSHDLAQVRRIADQVTLLDREVRGSGPADVLPRWRSDPLRSRRGAP